MAMVGDSFFGMMQVELTCLNMSHSGSLWHMMAHCSWVEDDILISCVRMCHSEAPVRTSKNLGMDPLPWDCDVTWQIWMNASIKYILLDFGYLLDVGMFLNNSPSDIY